jgi:hypothetical protein
MSNTDRGKKISRQNDLSSYFQRPQSKNTHSLHASSSFEQPITERDVNSCENESNIQIIDKEICSSGDQSEINAFHQKLAIQMSKIFRWKITQPIHGKDKRDNGT